MRKVMLAASLFFVALLFASNADAVTMGVNTTNDSFAVPGECSLRSAVHAAEQDSPTGGCPAGSGVDVVQVPAGTYKLSRLGSGEGSGTTGDLDVTGPDKLTIEPAGSDAQVTIDGLRKDRIFDHLGAGGELEITGMTLTRGLAKDGGSESDGSEGGAIRSLSGKLILRSVLLFDSRSLSDGGAVYSGAQLSVINSTVSANRADRSGGAVFNDVNGTAAVRSSTIAFNRADSNVTGTGAGGGIFDQSALGFNMVNTILSDNVDATASDPDPAPDCRSGPSFFPRYVISTQALGSGQCLTGFDPGTNLAPANPRIESLADNVGQTFTHAIAPGSLAIDAGGPVGSIDECPLVDQRGVLRPAGQCDIGAYEYDANTLPAEPLPGRREPSPSVATYEAATGKLHIRLKCPARFKPKCISKALPLTRKRNGQPMAAVERVKTLSSRFRRVTFQIKPAFRGTLKLMTFIDRKKLVVRQQIRSKRVGAKKTKRPATVFHTYKVRVRL